MPDNLILFFDTETNGLPDWRAPSDAVSQPHIVQLAMLLEDDAGKEHGACNVIIRPDGWVIPEHASAIHGITTERALAEGIPEAEAVAMFCHFFGRARLHVAHNLNFDRRIMRIALLRSGLTRQQIEAMEAAPSLCTMQAATKVVNLPPTERMLAAGRTSAKSPSLAECVQHFFGEKMEGAHDAMVDVRACAMVYRRLGEQRQEAA